jgi:hypothetical protein
VIMNKLTLDSNSTLSIFLGDSRRDSASQGIVDRMQLRSETDSLPATLRGIDHSKTVSSGDIFRGIGFLIRIAVFLNYRSRLQYQEVVQAGVF